ncbi:helix-turn-helix domain-containing protein [Desulfosporosinus sp. PR]|uniref:helix-turn-helix domain-containing protein n=1 Tax=Candidatus Desulfosporosinus nitrosoreducens TaxID=3401928 RepID=UPI0027E65CD4|nr:helix-turn-helix domain-containing protein [Desulfosporosinus sp. PR]MDQ7096500.1 helix-turn-helix domain-containing protein [Desulfosporosinus sp. PR]
MFKEKALPVSIFCLAISLLISALIIAGGMKRNGEYVSAGLSGTAQSLNYIGSNIAHNPAADGKTVYDLDSAASYLGISKESLIKLADDPGSEIPCIKISGNTYVFGKSALDKWLETARVEIQ